jgi:hypothetical protein
MFEIIFKVFNHKRNIVDCIVLTVQAVALMFRNDAVSCVLSIFLGSRSQVDDVPKVFKKVAK